jgi:hypothetical protein
MKFSRAVERMMDFDRGPGKILKYDLKRGNFRSLGPPFEVWAPVKNTASPPLSTALNEMEEGWSYTSTTT